MSLLDIGLRERKIYINLLKTHLGYDQIGFTCLLALASP